MADFSKDIVNQLKETNKKLGILERQGIEEDSPRDIIKHALPEVLAERKYSFMEPKKLGLFKIDDILIKQAENQKIWNKQLVDQLIKQTESLKTFWSELFSNLLKVNSETMLQITDQSQANKNVAKEITQLPKILLSHLPNIVSAAELRYEELQKHQKAC